MRCCVKGVLVLYLPTTPTPAIEPTVMPAIEPDESPDEPSSVVGTGEVSISVELVIISGVGAVSDGLVESDVFVRDVIVASLADGSGDMDRAVVGLSVVVDSAYGTTVSVKAKKQKRVEGESLKCSLYDNTLKMYITLLRYFTIFTHQCR